MLKFGGGLLIAINYCGLATGVAGAGGGGMTTAPPPGRRCADAFMTLTSRSEVPMRNATRKGFVFMAAFKLSFSRLAARVFCDVLETFL